MNHTKKKNLVYSILLIFFIGCQGEDGTIGPSGQDGTNGLSSLVNTTNEASGTNCENGGIKVEIGIDSNSNGSLDIDEILSTTYVCNGVDGDISLTSVTTEPAGTNCANGGLKIDSGVDANGDRTLDATEITATAYVCNGIDGYNSLTKITTEAAGTNCANGGLKIDSGVDTNGDGTLDTAETTATAYICNGIDGNNSLTKITTEAAGTNCTNGGLKIDSGVDANGDATLDTTEISATAYVCNGIDGNNSLTKITTEAAGTNCTNGGLKIDSGVDANGDATLDTTEISATAYVCNGIDGNNSLTKITTEAAGTNCVNGGLKIDSGVDKNDDGTLDTGEVIATAYVCNGTNGNVSLVNISEESAGTTCKNGGVKIESGVDSDGNGTLDAGEIQITRYVCNGIDGGFDELIRLSFGTSNLSAGSNTNWVMSSNQNDYLLHFNKSNYLDADSIVVGIQLSTSNSAVKCFGELFDVTNNASISNSQMESTLLQTDPKKYVFSGNIFSNLPDANITLAIRIRTETLFTPVQGGYPSYINIYRSN